MVQSHENSGATQARWASCGDDRQLFGSWQFFVCGSTVPHPLCEAGHIPVAFGRGRPFNAAYCAIEAIIIANRPLGEEAALCVVQGVNVSHVPIVHCRAFHGILAINSAQSHQAACHYAGSLVQVGTRQPVLLRVRWAAMPHGVPIPAIRENTK